MSENRNSPIVPATDLSPKHRQGAYTLPDGSVRVIYAQRILGHVRLTDEPEAHIKGARAYLIERCVEADPVSDGTSAAAHLNAIVTDYLEQARRLRRCPLERDSLLTDAPATHMIAPKATKASPFDIITQYGGDTFAEAISIRAEQRRAAQAVAA